MTAPGVLHDVLEHATLAAFIADAGDGAVTEEALLDAEITALDIDPDSDLGRAFGVIFGKIRQAAMA